MVSVDLKLNIMQGMHGDANVWYILRVMQVCVTHFTYYAHYKPAIVFEQIELQI